MTRQTDYTTRATLTAIAQSPAPSAVPFTLAGLAWQLDTLAATAVCDAGEKAMRHRHAKTGAVRRSVRVAKAVGALTLQRSPRWARALAVACLAIPGPVDELVIWPALVAYVALRNWGEMAAVARQAWSR